MAEEPSPHEERQEHHRMQSGKVITAAESSKVIITVARSDKPVK
jgi:hypothetical protein